MNIPYHLFKMVTNNFSEDKIIGTGGFGNVYKGELHNGDLIAVKMLHPLQGLDEERFKNEFCNNLFKFGHPNITGLLGYCDEIHSIFVEHKGGQVSSKHVYRGLCFEYFPNGSLQKHLHEQSLAPNWGTRYGIIKGICEGLNFLHGCKPPIFHLDLKPANILLDSSMVPKLADFGLSRLFRESHSQVTQQRIGTDKYMPQEYRNGGKISEKYDVFSLGVVMIEIMEGYSLFEETDDATRIKHEVLTKWGSMIEPTTEQLLQMETCIDTALCCVDSKRESRPTIASILDALNKTETGIPKTQIAVGSLFPTIDRKNSLAETLKMMISELDNIKIPATNIKQIHDITKTSSTVEEPVIIKKTEDRETSSYVEEGLIIGRTKEKKEILSILSESSSNKTVILPIYGIGGIGKTTLAQLVFNDTQFNGYSRVWVYVSEQLDLYKIGNCIISQLSKEISNIANMQILQNRLAELFVDKRIIIVLDDLWEKDAHKLDKLKQMLCFGKGSKAILVTTRDEAIARIICSTVKNVKYKLEILSDDKCWAIIKQKSDFENQADKTFLEQIGRNIATKCGGIALAAQSLGYMLRYMTSDQWESVRDSDIWNLSNSEDPSVTTHRVLASLRLSYSHMHEFLKLCFSYCAVFPKGHIIAKYDLIHQWIALEFKPSGIFDSMQTCEQYVRQLLGMSFLQYAKIPMDGGYTKFLTMHDLVHDLATVTLANKVHKNGNDVGSSFQYALVRDPSKPLQSFVSSPQNLKALHFLDCKEILLGDGAISPAKFLLVLDLSGCCIWKLPDSIGQLKQLRYLDAPMIGCDMTPSCISKLSKLSYLGLARSGIRALPDTIGDINGLMYLDLSGCQDINELPVSFAELKQLVHLDLSLCKASIQEYLGCFTKLQYLNLKMTKTKVLPEVIGKLTKLRYLNLSRCKVSETNLHNLLLAVGTLYHLEYLDLSQNNKLTHIPECIASLSKLQTLNLTCCYEIDELPSCMNKMVSLKIVHMATYVLKISKLECSSNLVLIEAIYPDKLKIIKLENVMSLEKVQNIKLILKRSVFDLELEWTVDCDTRLVDDKDVLEVLVPPDTIKRFNISGYTSPSFPRNWLMCIGQYLRKVEKITLQDLPKCNSLPPLGQLPNLQFLSLDRLGCLEEMNTADSCGELMFPKLERLHIKSCRKLTLKPCPPRALSTLSIEASDNMFPKLHTLSIKYCPKLRMKPCLPRALSELSINASDNMLTSWEESVSRTSSSSSSCLLANLTVERSTVPLYQWRLLQHVSALRTLIVSDCSDLTSCSPEVLQCLSSLESLDLKDDILTELPKWLLEITSLQRLTISVPMLEKLPQWIRELTPLKELKITDCKGIRYLPGSIRDLTKLEKLWIENYCLRFFEIRKMFSSISADTDEVEIQRLIEEHKKEQAEEETACMEEIWPFTRQQPIDTSSESGSTSTKPLELHMFKEIVAGEDFPEDQATTTGIILLNKTKKYWVDKNGNNCFMLFPRGMSISWAENPDCWTWHIREEGSDSGDVGIEVVELKRVCWLEIVGKQELAHLTPGVTYEVVFEAMLKRNFNAWGTMLDLRMKFPNGRGQNCKKRLGGDVYSMEKLRLKVGDVEAQEGINGELMVSMSEHSSKWKRGLVVKCIRITPKEIS